MGAHEVYVVLACGSGPGVRMGPGDLVGRLRSADLRIDDPRVSEAHAYVSLREDSLRLLALRGGLAVDGRLVREVSLARGLRILLAKGDPPVELVVREAVHPNAMLALRGPGLDDEVLTGRSLSLVRDPGLGCGRATIRAPSPRCGPTARGGRSGSGTATRTRSRRGIGCRWAPT